MTPIEKAVQLRRRLIEASDDASRELNEYCKPFRGDMGLVSDECKNSEMYNLLNRNYMEARDNLALFNMTYNTPECKKAFKAETMRHYGRA